jgi:hypothetical protein
MVALFVVQDMVVTMHIYRPIVMILLRFLYEILRLILFLLSKMLSAIVDAGGICATLRIAAGGCSYLQRFFKCKIDKG